MFKQLRKKALRSRLPVVIIAGVALAAILAYLLPSLLMLLRGPADLYAMTADELEGAYVTADINNFLDSYAQTTRSSDNKPDEVIRSEYLLPVADVIIGVEVNADNIDVCDAIVEDTFRYLTDEDGSYVWDGSHVVITGTIRHMDEETEGYFRETLSYWFDEEDIDANCLPLVLREDAVGSMETDEMLLFGVLGAVALAVFLWALISGLTGGAPRTVKAYLATRPDPEGAERELDELYETQPEEGGRLKMDRRWLLCDRGPDGFVLAAEDVVWAYQSVTTHRTYGIPTGKTYAVIICSGSEPKGRSRHTIAVKNEEEARAILNRIAGLYPGAALGYNRDLDAAYNRDPVGFRQRIAAARAAAAQAAAQQAAQVAAEPAATLPEP